MDELPEFQPQVLDALRQPLETGEVLVARANAHVRYPARVQLVAAQNPCRCGHGGAGRKAMVRQGSQAASWTYHEPHLRPPDWTGSTCGWMCPP